MTRLEKRSTCRNNWMSSNVIIRGFVRTVTAVGERLTNPTAGLLGVRVVSASKGEWRACRERICIQLHGVIGLQDG